jgi:PIN domain nuclease of toxin-antitoxin system
MNLLLDTHSLIWLLEGDEKLSPIALQAIQSPLNTPFISSASLWEIAIKISIEKLSMESSYEDLTTLIWENGIEILPLDFEHYVEVIGLPFHHKDPFDRIIIAQAIVEEMVVVGKDSNFVLYGIQQIW